MRSKLHSLRLSNTEDSFNVGKRKLFHQEWQKIIADILIFDNILAVNMSLCLICLYWTAINMSLLDCLQGSSRQISYSTTELETPSSKLENKKVFIKVQPCSGQFLSVFLRPPKYGIHRLILKCQTKDVKRCVSRWIH